MHEDWEEFLTVPNIPLYPRCQECGNCIDAKNSYLYAGSGTYCSNLKCIRAAIESLDPIYIRDFYVTKEQFAEEQARRIFAL